MTMVCQTCERSAEELDRLGKLKYVQGYAQCADCGGDLEYDTVVKRSKNKQINAHKCAACGYLFYHHLIFVGQGPDKCPQCGHTKVPRASIQTPSAIVVQCHRCDSLRTVVPRLEDNSLWTVNQTCGCGGTMYPRRVSEGELAAYDEQPEATDG